ncbi:MAG: hypothetical protein IJL25_04230 [Clostridia bacterium]|nr:hypothetical protein [Clostridia bacterium]
MTKTNKIVIAITAELLIAVFCAVAAAVHKPAETDGSFVQEITDRVRFTVSPTAFTFAPPEEDEPLEFRFTLTAEKNEADFYAVIHSVTLTGANYESVRFQTESGADNAVPHQLVLPAENGKAQEVRWEVTVRLPADAAGTNAFELAIDYTAGITQETADEHILTVPLKVTIE